MADNYYWILPYAKRLKTFFASDIQEELKKDDIYFHIGTITRALQYWISSGEIKILSTKYFSHSGYQKINKYIYVEKTN